MSKEKIEKLLVFIHRDSIMFCRVDQEQSFELQITPDIINNLEVVDPNKLDSIIQQTITQAGLEGSKIVVVLDENTYFRKSLKAESSDPVKEKAQIDKFSTIIPFDDIFIKRFKYKKNIEIIAINRDFYEPILDSLKKLGLDVIMILPDLVIPGTIGQGSCTSENGSSILKSTKKLKSYDLLKINTPKTILKIEKNAPAPEDRKRLITLAVLFGFLIVLLLGALIFSSNRSKKDRLLIEQRKAEQEAAAATPIINTNITPTTVILPTATPVLQKDIDDNQEIIDFSKYSIRVLNGSGIAGQAGIIKESLESVGFEKIETGNAGDITSNTTLVLISSNLPTAVKSIILEKIVETSGKYTLKESNQLDYDVVITTSKAVNSN